MEYSLPFIWHGDAIEIDKTREQKLREALNLGFTLLEFLLERRKLYHSCLNVMRAATSIKDSRDIFLHDQVHFHFADSLFRMRLLALFGSMSTNIISIRKQSFLHSCQDQPDSYTNIALQHKIVDQYAITMFFQKNKFWEVDLVFALKTKSDLLL